MLCCPFLSISLSRVRNHNILNVVAVFLLLSSLPWLFKNQSRPLIGKNSIFNTSRLDQYFNNCPQFKKAYRKSALVCNSQQYKNIGLDLAAGHGKSQLDVNSWEYPIWVLTKGCAKPMRRIEHINVKNESNKMSYGKFKPCLVLKADNDSGVFVVGTSSFTWEGRYEDGWIRDGAILRLENIAEGEVGVLFITVLVEKHLEMLPIKVSLSGEKDRKIDLIIGKENLWNLVVVSHLLSEPNGEIHISASKRWRPIEFGINDDHRPLSIWVRYGHISISELVDISSNRSIVSF